jgi:hypothetical protein
MKATRHLGTQQYDWFEQKGFSAEPTALNYSQAGTFGGRYPTPLSSFGFEEAHQNDR